MKEPLDRNKSDLTHRITSLAMIYLYNCGFKPIVTETPVGNGWIADIASFCLPNCSETKRLKLRSCTRFGLNNSDYSEIEFSYGPILTAIVEVKVNRSDFIKDKNRKFAAEFPAHLCYLAYPYGMLQQEEIPVGWLALEMTSTGTMLRKKHWTWASPHRQHPGEIAEFIAAIAIRADNRQRYAQNRLMMKMYRAGKITKKG